MGIIAWIIFGALVGWIASMIAGTDAEQGAVANILVGIAGAFIGGLIGHLLGGTGVTGFNLGSVLLAILGAVVLLFLMKSLRGGHSSRPLSE
jgi:uncharacterized membrane protein YeaQ/YmgE (transglycosylase-associated protein family)